MKPLPPFLQGFRRQAAANPARDLALIGVTKRKAKARAKSNAFHREMRKALGLPPVAQFED